MCRNPSFLNVCVETHLSFISVSKPIFPLSLRVRGPRALVLRCRAPCVPDCQMACGSDGLKICPTDRSVKTLWLNLLSKVDQSFSRIYGGRIQLSTRILGTDDLFHVSSRVIDFIFMFLLKICKPDNSSIEAQSCFHNNRSIPYR